VLLCERKFSPYRGSLCVTEYTTLPKTFRINCIDVKGIGKVLRAEVAVIPVLWSGLIKIREPEVLECHWLLKQATNAYKNVSEVLYGSRILNNSSDAVSAPLICYIRQRIDVARHWLLKSPHRCHWHTEILYDITDKKILYIVTCIIYNTDAWIHTSWKDTLHKLILKIISGAYSTPLIHGHIPAERIWHVTEFWNLPVVPVARHWHMDTYEVKEYDTSLNSKTYQWCR
jgi:hypothetical protein